MYVHVNMFAPVLWGWQVTNFFTVSIFLHSETKVQNFMDVIFLIL